MSTICCLDGSFIKTPSGIVQLFLANFLLRALRLCHASSAVHEWNHSMTPWPQAIRISQETIELHTHRQTRSEKQFNLRTSKRAKLQNPSPDTEPPIFSPFQLAINGNV